MRRNHSVTILLVAVLSALAATVYAQGTALEGTVTLKGGQTLTGEIKVAQVGVLQGCGIGTLLPDMGFFRVKVGDKVVEVKAADLAVAEVEWGLASETDPQSWEIKQISLLQRDGTTVTGKPTWSVQATAVKVGTQPEIYAFPKAGMDFKAENLLTKIEIAGAAPATTPPDGATPPPGTEPPTTPIITPPAGTAPTTPPVVPGTPQPTIGQGAMEVVVICPKCGEKMIVRIEVNVAPAANP